MTDVEHAQTGQRLNWDQGNNIMDSEEELLDDDETNSAKLFERSRIRALAGELIYCLVVYEMFMEIV